MPQSILIVHDDAEASAELGRVVTTLGYDVKTATDGNELIESVDTNSPVAVDLLLTVLSFDIVESLAYLGDVAQKRPEVPVIVLSHDGDDAVVGQAIKAGAADVLLIPVGPERLRISIQNALKLNSLSGQVSRLSRRYEGEMGFQDLIGQSPGMRRVGDLASRAAASNISILIEGESGVGKEMVARAIQGESDRAGKPFVAVNCGAIPENLVESILFGHEKGAFTGANTRHIGKFQEADGGTLFLDEIGELRPDIQVKLLRALQEQTHASLKRNLLEECYEVLEAIDRGDPDPLAEELGDLLVQIAFHADIARENGEFTMADVLTAVNRKLVRRHPHVFGDVEVADAREVERNWERLKEQERAEKGISKSPVEGIPKDLPALV